MTKRANKCFVCSKDINAKKDLVFVCVDKAAHWECAERENLAFTHTDNDAAFWQGWGEAPASLFASQITRKNGQSMKIGYARVSREEQSLDMQVAALKEAGCEEVFTDKISGARSSRPALDAMIQTLRKGDEVVVWKMDRIGRTLLTMIGILEKIGAKGVGVSSLTEPTLGTAGPQGKLVLHILGAVAEYELGLISERTKEGVSRARARGAKMGRPRTLNALQRQEIVEAVASGRLTRADAARIHKVSAPTISRIILQAEKDMKNEGK